MTNSHNPASDENNNELSAIATDVHAENEKEGKSRRSRGERRRRVDSGKTSEVKEFEESILQIDRVTRVVAGGRRLRFRVSVVIGDQKGRVGFALGKSSEVMIGIQKAVSKAKRNLISVPFFEGTIPHPVDAKFKASKVLLFPAPEGTGIIAGGAVRKILELAGVRNVLSKIHGSRNRINVAYATLLAVEKLQNKKPLQGKKSQLQKEIEDASQPEEKKEVKKSSPKSKK